MTPLAMVLVASLLICFGLHTGQGAKILALLNVASPSHNIFNSALTVALAERGHQVLYFALFGVDTRRKQRETLSAIS
jgi:hypothetical protein